MTSPFAVDATLPKDLADLFRDAGTAEAPPVRSTMSTLVVGGIAVASTAVTFLQGPPAVAYWVEVTRGWLRRRRGEGVGELRIKGPNGTAVITITAETDLTAVAAALHGALFPGRETPPDEDDLAL